MSRDWIYCKLAVLLKRKKWSLYKLRQVSGVSYPTLLGLFHNRTTRYDAPVLANLCRALRCQPGDLLVWEPSRPRRFPRLRKTR